MSDPGGKLRLRGEWPAGLAPLVSTEPLKGGFICSTVRAGWPTGGRWWSSAARTSRSSFYGLQALAAAGVPVPAVLGVAGQALVLERVGGPPDWAGLGGPSPGCTAPPGTVRLAPRQLAGITVQPNGWSDDWPASTSRTGSGPISATRGSPSCCAGVSSGLARVRCRRCCGRARRRR